MHRPRKTAPAEATALESGTMDPSDAGGASGGPSLKGPRLPGRYVDLGPVAEGAFGEVRRVHDAVLGRPLVVKILKDSRSLRPTVRRRFFAEVQITAQLQHPGVTPVYDHGELPDGRLWYAMKEVRGRTLRDILEELFDEEPQRGAEIGAPRWTRWRALDVVARVAQTVAYAHRQGIVHRDLKPENVMVGELGEVMVMDWGLARRRPDSQSPSRQPPVSLPPNSQSPNQSPNNRSPNQSPNDQRPNNQSLNSQSPALDEGAEEDIDLARAGDLERGSSGDPFAEEELSSRDSGLTQHGDVLGTPAYMPPEQALGARDLHGPGSDVYALGAILYHVLTGRPPYRGSGPAIVEQIRGGPPTPIEEVAPRGTPPPADLARAAERAMRRRVEERCSAEEFAADILAFLDGARRREQALSVVETAQRIEREIAGLREEESKARDEAEALAGLIRPFDPVESKRPVWEREDERARIAQEASRREADWLFAMHGALRIDPELPEAHAALADHYRARVIEAEAQRRSGDAARFEAMLRSHDRGRHAAFLRGEGSLTLVTDPPGAAVFLERYEVRDRRLFPVDRGLLGTTPLLRAPLPRGSYRLRIQAPGREEVLYPVLIERDAEWHGAPPGERDPAPVHLPRAGEIGPHEALVSAGPAWIGGHALAGDSLPRRRLWIDAFVIDKHPVTAAEWLSFLNDLSRSGRESEAILACPRGHATRAADVSALAFPRDREGLFTLSEEFRPDVPIMRVDWRAAMAYARWRSARTGIVYRLPSELEREKAARGADERLLPWGDHPDATFACVADSHEGEIHPASIHDYPADESPYGVRGLAGNVRDPCMEVWRREGPLTRGDRLILDPANPEDPSPRAVRGGAWGSPLSSSWSAGRFATRPDLAWKWVGVRLCRSWPVP